MTRHLTADALSHLQRWEGLVLYAYDDADRGNPKRFIGPGDPVVGTLTIGYGHTRTVRPGMRISEADAVRLFREDLAPAEAAVFRIVQVPLTDNQFAALVSFAFNLGTSTARGSPLWNVAETLNKGDYAGAVRRMGLYVKQRQGGQLVTVQGLVNRRAAEAGLWARGDFVASASVVPAEPAAPSTRVDAGMIGAAAAAAPAVASVVSSFSAVPWPVALVIVCAALAGGALYLLKRQRAA